MQLGYTLALTSPLHGLSVVINQVLGVLSKYGTDAHMWIPGIGTINGFLAGNFVDALLTTPATPGSLVGAVLDCGGGVSNIVQALDAYRPTLQTSPYRWEFNGTTKTLPVTAPVFQMSDNFCVVSGVSVTTTPTSRAIFGQSNTSNNALPEFLFDNVGRLGVYAFGGGGLINSFSGPDNRGVGPIVASLVKEGTSLKVRRNAVEIATASASGTYNTATTFALGVWPTLTASESLHGSLYPVIAIKGSIIPEDLQILENFIASWIAG